LKKIAKKLLAKELIEINPGDVKTRMLLGRSLAQVGRYDEALSALDGVTKRLSTYPQVYYLKAKVYLKIKNYKKAMEAGEMEKKNNPKIYHGHYILGETERLIGKYSKATKNLERAISIEPRNVESLMSLGWIKLNQSRYDIARELYLRAKKKAPSNPNIRKQLAFIYQGIGQGGLAVEEFKTYLKLYPNAPDRTQIQNQIRTLSR
jgi:tetratricopeptide (TPR) repeat protein